MRGQGLWLGVSSLVQDPNYQSIFRWGMDICTFLVLLWRFLMLQLRGLYRIVQLQAAAGTSAESLVELCFHIMIQPLGMRPYVDDFKMIADSPFNNDKVMGPSTNPPVLPSPRFPLIMNNIITSEYNRPTNKANRRGWYRGHGALNPNFLNFNPEQPKVKAKR